MNNTKELIIKMSEEELSEIEDFILVYKKLEKHRPRGARLIEVDFNELFKELILDKVREDSKDVYQIAFEDMLWTGDFTGFRWRGE